MIRSRRSRWATDDLVYLGWKSPQLILKL